MAEGGSMESSGFYKPEAVDGGLTPPRPGLGQDDRDGHGSGRGEARRLTIYQTFASRSCTERDAFKEGWTRIRNIVGFFACFSKVIWTFNHGRLRGWVFDCQHGCALEIAEMTHLE
jgi:hypothetical protein